MKPDHNNTPALPGDAVLPPAPNLHDILHMLAMAFSKLPGADASMIVRAHVALDNQYQKGYLEGQRQGSRDGYQLGYREGFDDGQREALDERAREEADRAMIKAAARTGGKR